jgi:hypothetical protein
LKSPKGQIFATDLIAAAVIFMLAIGALLLTWDYGKTRLDETAKMREMERESQSAADILVKTPGNPPDWEKNPQDGNITSIGLAVDDRTINPKKMMALPGIGIKTMRENLRIGSDMPYITLRTPEGETIIAGEQPNATESVRTTRIVSYNGRAALLEVTIWAAR